MQNCDHVDVSVLSPAPGAPAGRIARAPGRVVVVPAAAGDIESVLAMRNLDDAHLDAGHLPTGSDVPGYVLVVTSRAQVGVFVHGPVALAATGGAGSLQLDVEPGRSGAYLLPPDCAVLVVTTPGADTSEPGPGAATIDEGIVAGGGARLTWIGGELPSGTTPAEPVATPAVPPLAVVDHTGTQPIPVVVGWDLPADSAEPSVHVPPPRPSAGVLRCDTGATFVLDMDCVIGRDPSADPAVRNGWARPVVLADYGRLVSRIHTQIVVQGTQALVMDRGSTNGTSILPPGTTSWSRLVPNQPVPVAPGTLVHIGNHTVRIDAH